MANQRINEAARLIDQLRSLDKQIKQVTAARSNHCKQINLGPLVFDSELSQMMLAMAANHLAERRSNIIERLETDFNLRDTA